MTHRKMLIQETNIDTMRKHFSAALDRVDRAEKRNAKLLKRLQALEALRIKALGRERIKS